MKLIVVLATLCIITTTVFGGAINVYYDNPTTKALLYVETDLIKVAIAATQGKITEWYVKSLDKDIALADLTGWGIVAQRLTIFDVANVQPGAEWPGGWPTPIGTGDYQTEVVAINGGKADIRQTYTVPAGSMFSGLRIEKTYTIHAKKYHIDVSYVITNTSNEVKSFTYNGIEYGINLTVETTLRCGASSSRFAFKSQGKVYSSVLPSLPFGPDIANYVVPLPILQWCAVADAEGGYVLGSKFTPGMTYALWPGEWRGEGYDFETLFRSVVYQPGHSEHYQFIVYGGPGSIEAFPQIALGKEAAPEMEGTPSSFILAQNYPNPFNPTTTIQYGLPERSLVTLTVYSMLGEIVATLVQGDQGAGYHEVRFDGSDLASGVYFYRLQAGTNAETKSFLLIR